MTTLLIFILISSNFRTKFPFLPIKISASYNYLRQEGYVTLRLSICLSVWNTENSNILDFHYN